jgi:hypothetical protein
MTRMAPKPGAAYRTQPAASAMHADASDAQRAPSMRTSAVSSAAQSTQLTLRWRVGRNGSLVLALEPAGATLRVAISLTPDTDRRGLARDVMSRASEPGGEARGTVPAAQALHYVGDADVVRAAGEWTIVTRLSRRPDADPHRAELGDSPAPAEFAARLSVIESAVEIESGRRPLILTDLPGKIGLAGGTYALDEGRAALFCEALDGALGARRAFPA